MNKAYQLKNAAAQRKDPNSLFNWYRSLIRLRKEETAVRRGDYRRLSDRDDVYCFERRWCGERIVVALNFSAGKREIRLPGSDRWTVLLREASSMEGGVGPSGPASQVLLSKHGILIAKSTA